MSNTEATTLPAGTELTYRLYPITLSEDTEVEYVKGNKVHTTSPVRIGPNNIITHLHGSTKDDIQAQWAKQVQEKGNPSIHLPVGTLVYVDDSPCLTSKFHHVYVTYGDKCDTSNLEDKLDGVACVNSKGRIDLYLTEGNDDPAFQELWDREQDVLAMLSA